MMDIGEEFLRLQSELMTEEQRGLINDISEIVNRKEKREEMKSRLATIERQVRRLRHQLRRLPALPDLVCIRWACSLLAFPNGCVLLVDTASSAEEAGIVHVLLQDFHGMVRLDRYVAPGCILSEPTMRSLGMATWDLYDAPSLPQIWPSLLEALKGRYVVSYDLERVRRVLEKGAEQYNLDPPAIIGDCLRQQCLRYFQAAGFVGLESLCKIIGYPLPTPPDCTAIDRAWGLLHLLRAMANGITGISQEVLPQADDEREDDLHL